ncbi:hypothetical protein EEL33_08920 [Muribaculaceae bacterium Isolate-037 (Harlan)]|jgi:hypothetical protein|nr:hypothetical protein EEL39_14785 [Muribaculaceae bacterium Isolate-080 (Janvier)]ROT06879.1 hypothetical protein EEL33_08920 [Muribaculaceae bacterium Isolate-037 (Harlan)]
MKGFFRRWKRKKSEAPANPKPVAQFSVTIYKDCAEFHIDDDEVKIGSALVTLLLNNQYAHKIIINSVISAEKERERQRAYAEMMAINLN